MEHETPQQEMISLNLEDLDIEVLEARLELTVGYLTGFHLNDGCNVNACNNYCQGNCTVHCGANCTANCPSNCVSNYCALYGKPQKLDL